MDDLPEESVRLGKARTARIVRMLGRLDGDLKTALALAYLLGARDARVVLEEEPWPRTRLYDKPRKPKRR
jgi:hypothetical protein